MIREVLVEHPDVELDEEEGSGTQDLRQRAGVFYNQLLRAGWLESRRPSLDEHYALISPFLRPLLRMLRQLAEQDPAELKDFAATLNSICRSLLAEGAFDHTKLTPDDFRGTVKDLLDRVEHAIEQLHAVETLVLSFEQRQRRSESGEATLHLFYTEFYEGEHMVCYDTLRRGGLLPRLNEARNVVDGALANPFAKEVLAQGLVGHRHMSPKEADIEAEEMLVRLERRLGSIAARARVIDGRIAAFARLSAQRYRYQTEVRGRRPEQVRAFLQAADERYAGRRFADLDEESGMNFRCPEVTLYYGRESLSPERKTRLPVDLSLVRSTTETDLLEAQDLIRRRNLHAITPQRAGRFVEKWMDDKEAKASTATVNVANADDFLDFLSAIAFERAQSMQTLRPVRWRVRQARIGRGLEPESVDVDEQGEWRVERVEFERVS